MILTLILKLFEQKHFPIDTVFGNFLDFFVISILFLLRRGKPISRPIFGEFFFVSRIKVPKKIIETYQSPQKRVITHVSTVFPPL